MFQDIYIDCTLGKCPNPQCSTILAGSVNQISNQLTAAIRRHIKIYYQVSLSIVFLGRKFK